MICHNSCTYSALLKGSWHGHVIPFYVSVLNRQIVGAEFESLHVCACCNGTAQRNVQCVLTSSREEAAYILMILKHGEYCVACD